MPIFLAVALGGGLGALSRYGVDRLIQRHSFSVWPWGTFAINISGCLVIGVIIAALVDREHTPLWLRTGLVVGFVGGYTTFSTFAQESLNLLENGTLTAAALYAFGSLILGVLAVFLGMQLGRAV